MMFASINEFAYVISGQPELIILAYNINKILFATMQRPHMANLTVRRYRTVRGPLIQVTHIIESSEQSSQSTRNSNGRRLWRLNQLLAGRRVNCERNCQKHKFILKRIWRLDELKRLKVKSYNEINQLRDLKFGISFCIKYVINNRIRLYDDIRNRNQLPSISPLQEHFLNINLPLFLGYTDMFEDQYIRRMEEKYPRKNPTEGQRELLQQEQYLGQVNLYEASFRPRIGQHIQVNCENCLLKFKDQAQLDEHYQSAQHKKTYRRNRPKAFKASEILEENPFENERRRPPVRAPQIEDVPQQIYHIQTRGRTKKQKNQ